MWSRRRRGTYRVGGGKFKDFPIKFETFIFTNSKRPKISDETLIFPKIRRFPKHWRSRGPLPPPPPPPRHPCVELPVYASGHPQMYVSNPPPPPLLECLNGPSSACLCHDRSKSAHAVRQNPLLWIPYLILRFSLAITLFTVPCFSILNLNSGIYSNI